MKMPPLEELPGISVELDPIHPLTQEQKFAAQAMVRCVQSVFRELTARLRQVVRLDQPMISEELRRRLYRDLLELALLETCLRYGLQREDWTVKGD